MQLKRFCGHLPITTSLTQLTCVRPRILAYLQQLLGYFTNAGERLVHEDMVQPVVSVSALTCFIKYVYYLNFQYLKGVQYTTGR